MNTKEQKKVKRSGLGRSLGELLSDNEEIGNVENKVLMHKSDGTTVKIYNKVDGGKSGGKSTEDTMPKREVSRAPGMNASFDTPERIAVGKTREERDEEARGIYRAGKPHVIPEGESEERIKISTTPKIESESNRIVLDGSAHKNGESVSAALGKLKRYTPNASDEFLEALRDMTDVPKNKDYKTDREGRIVIGATKSRVKKR
jgi:hypothetical protein